MPVAIHTSDPEVFFLPIDRFNERFEELNNHPDWSFHGKDFPSNAELLEARNRMYARHPKTNFISLHVGNDAENLGYVPSVLTGSPICMWIWRRESGKLAASRATPASSSRSIRTGSSSAPTRSAP